MENVTETEIISTPDETSVTDTSADVAPEILWKTRKFSNPEYDRNSLLAVIILEKD